VGLVFPHLERLALGTGHRQTRNRFVLTIKESCLERMILFGEGAVRKATAEFMAHYHSERNHQGLE
jgi:hypothetical protein